MRSTFSCGQIALTSTPPGAAALDTTSSDSFAVPVLGSTLATRWFPDDGPNTGPSSQRASAEALPRAYTSIGSVAAKQASRETRLIVYRTVPSGPAVLADTDMSLTGD